MWTVNPKVSCWRFNFELISEYEYYQEITKTSVLVFCVMYEVVSFFLNLLPWEFCQFGKNDTEKRAKKHKKKVKVYSSFFVKKV